MARKTRAKAKSFSEALYGDGPDRVLCALIMEAAKDEEYRFSLPTGINFARGLCAVATALGVDWPFLVVSACVEKVRGPLNHRPVDVNGHRWKAMVWLPLFDAVTKATRAAWSVRRGGGTEQERIQAASHELREAATNTWLNIPLGLNQAGQPYSELQSKIAEQIVFRIRSAGRGRTPVGGFGVIVGDVLSDIGADKARPVKSQDARAFRKDLERSRRLLRDNPKLLEEGWMFVQQELEAMLADKRRLHGERSSA